MNSLSLIIFGITSNLAQIKLIPALYDMSEKGLLPDDMVIIGNSRSPFTKNKLADYIKTVIYSENRHHRHPIKDIVLEGLIKKFHHISGSLDDPTTYEKIRSFIKNHTLQDLGSLVFYLATYPDLYESIFESLAKTDLNKQGMGFVRVMIEKPIGSDLKSAQKLNSLLKKYFTEDQIYRLDHYLGKETLQNMLTFRFGNGILEPLINNQFIDHIQITAAEDFGIGERGGYFDKVGTLKDVGQNHQLQMLAFATMDAPIEFSNQAITDKRIKILNSLVPDPKNIIFGQYQGYRKEKNVSGDSQTDTFYAFKTQINNQRFKGVPIYIRAGKKLAQTVTEIAIFFKKPNNRMFRNLDCGEEPNVLIYRIQPNEGIVLKVLVKKPGHALELIPEYMQYCYKTQNGNHSFPDPYEKLISDTIRGDQTFFNDATEIESQWKFIDPLVKAKTKPIPYIENTWGPKEALELIEKDGRKWLLPSMDFCKI